MQSQQRAFSRLATRTARTRRLGATRQLATAVDPAQKVSRALSLPGPSTELTTLKDPTELDQITTLQNGIRVATESLPGPFSGVGVYLDAGSRFENEELRGVSHIVDRLAFKVGCRA